MALDGNPNVCTADIGKQSMAVCMGQLKRMLYLVWTWAGKGPACQRKADAQEYMMSKTSQF